VCAFVPYRASPSPCVPLPRSALPIRFVARALPLRHRPAPSDERAREKETKRERASEPEWVSRRTKGSWLSSTRALCS